MSSAKRHLFIALTFVLAAATFAVLTPRAVHAITATLVQVMNTSANPVPTADAAIRFQTALCQTAGTVGPAAIGNCSLNGAISFVVPTTTSTGLTVKRLSVDNVSGFCSSFDNPGLFIKAIRLRGSFVPDAVPNTAPSFTHYVPMAAPPFSYVNSPSAPAPYTNHQETDVTFGQTTHFAFNAGDTVSLETVYFFTEDPVTQDYYCIARVEGSLITQ